MIVILFLSLLLAGNSSANSPAYFPGAKNQLLEIKTPQGSSSALLSVPSDKNGKLILYLHPTTGIDDQCAPSKASATIFFRDDGMRRQLRELLSKGYSILQPDYQGLGGPGKHPFFDLPANIPAISLALRQAFDRERSLSGSYLSLGYSQGASLALEVSHRSALLPGVLRGSVAIAPGSKIGLQMKMASLIDEPASVSAVLIYLLRSYGYSDLLSKKAKAVIRKGRGMCVLEFSSLVVRQELSPKETLTPGSWDSGRRKQFLIDLRRAENNLPLTGGNLLLGGSSDRTVFPSLVQRLAEISIAEHREFASDHFSLPFESWPFVRRWISRSFSEPPARFYLPLRKK